MPEKKIAQKSRKDNPQDRADRSSGKGRGAVCRRNVTFDDSLGHTVGELPYRPAKFTEKELQAAVEMALVD